MPDIGAEPIQLGSEARLSSVVIRTDPTKGANRFLAIAPMATGTRGHRKAQDANKQSRNLIGKKLLQSDVADCASLIA